MEIAAVRKINDSKMRVPAGIPHFAAQQAGTCQGMWGRQWERDAWTRNKRERERLKVLQRKGIVGFFTFIIYNVPIHKLNGLITVPQHYFALQRCITLSNKQTVFLCLSHCVLGADSAVADWTWKCIMIIWAAPWKIFRFQRGFLH